MVRHSGLKVVAFLVVAVLTATLTWRLLEAPAPASAGDFHAVFTDASALTAGDDVRVAGVAVGRVDGVELDDDYRTVVSFSVSDEIRMTDQTRAAVRYKDLTGNRYLALSQGIAAAPAVGGTPLSPGATIPVARTTPALDLDALFGGFQPLFKALTPEQVNRLSTGLLQILQGEGSNVMAVLRDIADFTATLGTRDAVIGQVVTNLNTVLASMTRNQDEFGQAVDRAQTLVSGLAAQRRQLSSGLQATGRLTGQLTDTLSGLRPELNATSDQLGRLSQRLTVPETAQGITKRLTQMPVYQKALAGIGSYGAWANFYVCGTSANYREADGTPVQLPWLTLPDKRCHW